LLTGFSLATVAGSSVGTTMSVAEEFDSFMKSGDDKSATSKPSDDGGFPIPAVAASLAVPMIGTLYGGDDMTFFLGLAGSIGTPLLYGLVPCAMAWKQRQEDSKRQANLVPGGMASLGALGLASTGFVGQELAHVMATTFMP
jgi:Tryptophan/tyrosine permease family